jgi:L-threonylcarbamoyladenylate synthase
LPRKSTAKSAPAEPVAQIFRIDDGIAALRGGALVVYPTETFYGIGADPFSPAALKRLFEVKPRDPERPVGLIAADTAMAFSVASKVPVDARRLADAFWPGPLTLVVPARADIAPELVGPGGVGVRVSPNPVARALAGGLGRPITATSANVSGQPPASTLVEARRTFGAKVEVYLEGGKLMAAAPSTVVAFDGGEWRMIRVGAISVDQIAAVLAGEALK